ncbi:DUF1576 domain-containing protein [Clostridium swellfunianum]|nr:DUF1576 domain-containing protein [Clostridium swellfunianum]
MRTFNFRKEVVIIEERAIRTKKEYLIFTFYSLSFIIFGLIVDSIKNIKKGIFKIIEEPDILITDYIGVGGIGATFVNSGIVALISLLILYKLKINITGAATSAIWLMAGFSLFGKNVFNIWFIIAGVWLYSRYQKENFSRYVFIAMFGTSLAPLVTQVMFGTGLPRVISISLGIIVGLLAGFVLPPLGAYLMRVHQGFNLYNVGFTAGIIGTITISVFKSYGFEIQSRLIWTSGNNLILGIFMFVLFSSMLVISYTMDKQVFSKYRKLFKYSGRLVSDFMILEGFAPSLFNMGINGIFATAYVLIAKGDLNGPTIGGILTIVGFSAFGKHLKNMVPIFLGVCIGSLTKVWNINDPTILMAALFGTTLAPIAGAFGWKWGVLAGFLHSSLVLNVGFLHGGVNLYNNGFSGGIIAATLIPIIEALRKDE